MSQTLLHTPADLPHHELGPGWPAPQRFLDVGHSRLAYWRFGRGPDVVFVHGWPLSAATFRHVVRELAADFTCHLVDLPGAGATETTAASPIDLAAHARTLRAGIDALGLARYALVAHDSGGFAARALAAEDPRASSLVLGNTEISGHTPPLLVLYALVGRVPGGAGALRAILGSRRLRQSPLGFGGCFTDPRSEDGEFHELFVRPLLESDQRLDGALALLRNTDKSLLSRLPEIHRRIAAPVQLVWGARDPWFPITKLGPTLAQLPNATLVEIPEGKLFAHEDHARAFAGHARGFLRRWA